MVTRSVSLPPSESTLLPRRKPEMSASRSAAGIVMLHPASMPSELDGTDRRSVKSRTQRYRAPRPEVSFSPCSPR